jgi:hypothetical protein
VPERSRVARHLSALGILWISISVLRGLGALVVLFMARAILPHLQVNFPAGSFTQKVKIQEGKGLALTARPRPRLAYLGFEGSEEFAGRERVLGMLENLGARLSSVAFLTAAKGESPQDCLARLQSTRGSELVLKARPVPGKPIHQVELTLATLTGQEEKVVVKPLEHDPLAAMVARMEKAPLLSVPWAGLVLLDLPGQPGPWVLQADAAAQKAGVKLQKPILQVNGKPVATVADFQRALGDAARAGSKVAVSQGEAAVSLAVAPQALELPVDDDSLCYPLLLADLRLRYLGASGDEAGFLRLQQALTLMHFREYDKALEVLRDTRVSAIQGVSQGTVDYYTGTCLLRMGSVYLTEAQQAFSQALKYPQATLFGPDGPLLAPLAKEALEDLKP